MCSSCLVLKIYNKSHKTSENISCHNIITQQNIARTVPNKLEKGTDRFACPPELVITRPCASFASQIQINSLC